MIPQKGSKQVDVQLIGGPMDGQVIQVKDYWKAISLPWKNAVGEMQKDALYLKIAADRFRYEPSGILPEAYRQ